MKKTILICIAFLFAGGQLNAQTQNAPMNSNKTVNLTGEAYLKKSKTQKTVGFVLIGAGLAAIAAVIDGNSSFSTTGAFVGVSGIAILGSIPFFIASGKNKRKAELMFKTEKVFVPAFRSSKVLALGVKINL